MPAYGFQRRLRQVGSFANMACQFLFKPPPVDCRSVAKCILNRLETGRVAGCPCREFQLHRGHSSGRRFNSFPRPRARPLFPPAPEAMPVAARHPRIHDVGEFGAEAVAEANPDIEQIVCLSLPQFR